MIKWWYIKNKIFLSICTKFKEQQFVQFLENTDSSRKFLKCFWNAVSSGNAFKLGYDEIAGRVDIADSVDIAGKVDIAGGAEMKSTKVVYNCHNDGLSKVLGSNQAMERDL